MVTFRCFRQVCPFDVEATCKSGEDAYEMVQRISSESVMERIVEPQENGPEVTRLHCLTRFKENSIVVEFI